MREIDYLLVGHITKDETAQGAVLGGPVSYAALTARALGYTVGIVTSWAEDLEFPFRNEIQIVNYPAEQTTTFQNTYSGSERQQVIKALAEQLDFHMVPEIWRRVKIAHFAPVANEVHPGMLRRFKDAFVGASLQGWLRRWDQDGKVYSAEWPEAALFLPLANAAVLSDEDVQGDWDSVIRMSASVPVLVATRNRAGAAVLYHGKEEQVPAVIAESVDETGAGDVFSVSFFHWLRYSRDPVTAAKFANQIAAFSVARKGISAVPDKEEFYDLMQEVV